MELCFSSLLLLILNERLYDATILERFLIYIGNKILLSTTAKAKYLLSANIEKILVVKFTIAYNIHALLALPLM